MIHNAENTTKLFVRDDLKYGIDHYPDKNPERYLNDFFNVDNFTDHLTFIFKQLYVVHEKFSMEQLWEPLLENFHYNEREEFSNNLLNYIFLIINRELSIHGKKGTERIRVPQVREFYISKLVEFIKLFLRNHLIRQEDYKTSTDYEMEVKNNHGYYFLDIAFNEFAIGKKIALLGRVKAFEQNSNEIYGVQNAIMGMEDVNNEMYDFEVDKGDYKKFRKKLDLNMNERIRFEFKVTRIIGPNHTQGEILGLF